VGRRAACLLWRGLPGRWTVRVSEANPGALLFWAGVIAKFTNDAATESKRRGTPNAWRVFSFESVPRRVSTPPRTRKAAGAGRRPVQPGAAGLPANKVRQPASRARPKAKAKARSRAARG
jgi:hypothetical protein